MTSLILKATPRQLPLSLACCVPSLTAHMLHVKLLGEDGFCDAVKLQDRDMYAWQASSSKRHSSAAASKLDLLRTKSHGPYASCGTVRYDFAMPLDYRIVIPLSCSHGKLHIGSATPWRLPRSLTRCVPRLSLFGQSSNLAQLGILKPFGTCAAAQAP